MALSDMDQSAYDPGTDLMDPGKSLEVYTSALSDFGIDPTNMTTAEARDKLRELEPDLDRLISENSFIYPQRLTCITKHGG